MSETQDYPVSHHNLSERSKALDAADLPTGLIEPGDPEYDETPGEAAEAAAGRQTIVVIIFAPKDVEPKRFRFPTDETVGAAAKVAADAFGYAGGNPSFQTQGGTVLDRNLTLADAGVRDREKLDLVDAGSGV
jgi:hypothetical protein